MKGKKALLLSSHSHIVLHFRPPVPSLVRSCRIFSPVLRVVGGKRITPATYDCHAEKRAQMRARGHAFVLFEKDPAIDGAHLLSLQRASSVQSQLSNANSGKPCHNREKGENVHLICAT